MLTFINLWDIPMYKGFFIKFFLDICVPGFKTEKIQRKI